MRVLGAGLLAVAIATSTAHADDPALAEARRLEAQLEYEPALVLVEKLLAAGGASPDQLVERHLLAGRLAAGLDRVDVAKAHFARVLALAPSTKLPDGTSPKLTEPFDAARALSPRLQIAARAGRASVELRVQGDPLEIVEGITARLGDGRIVREAHGTRVDTPAGMAIVEVSALDAHGNVLWTGAAPRALDSDGAPARPGPPPFYQRWTVWAGAGTFALAVGGLAAWRFNVAQDDWNDLEAAGADYTELRDVEARGRRWGWAANISFGLTAAAGIAAIAVLVANNDADAPGLAVTASATSTSLGVGVAGSF